MLRMAKDQSANSEINKSMVDMFQNLFGMAKSLVREQAEMYGQSSGPAWLPAVQQLGAEVGRVAQVYAMTKAKESAQQGSQQAQQAQLQAQRQRQQQMLLAQQQAQQRALAQQQAQQQAQAQAQVSRAAEPTPEDIRAQASQQVFGGAEKIAPPVVEGAAPPPSAEPKRKRGRPRKEAAPVEDGDEGEDEGEAAAPGAAVDLSKIPVANLKPVTDQMDDQEFFGEALSQVEVLRTAVANQNLPPDEVANAVLMSRQYFTAFGQLPPAIELLQAGHLELLVSRLVPQAPLGYQADVIKAIKEKLAGEEPSEG
jgi:hypothetical protein